ncbi:MAG: hypothetical protein WC799_10310 [Desulfobacteraceae bacterium]
MVPPLCQVTETGGHSASRHGRSHAEEHSQAGAWERENLKREILKKGWHGCRGSRESQKVALRSVKAACGRSARSQAPAWECRPGGSGPPRVT